MAVIIAFVGAVTFGIVAWLAVEVVREHRRRRHVYAVRAQLIARPTVAELRAKCDADSMPSYPTPAVSTVRAHGRHSRILLPADTVGSSAAESAGSDIGATA